MSKAILSNGYPGQLLTRGALPGCCGTSSWSTFHTVGTNLQRHAADHTNRNVLLLAPRSYLPLGGLLRMHREGRIGLRIPWTWEVLTAAVYHDNHLFPTGGKGHHSPTATRSIVPTCSWLPYWFLLPPEKPVGWSGSVSKPISFSSQDPPLDWTPDWSLYSWVPRYYCCCLLH